MRHYIFKENASCVLAKYPFPLADDGDASDPDGLGSIKDPDDEPTVAPPRDVKKSKKPKKKTKLPDDVESTSSVSVTADDSSTEEGGHQD